MSCYLLTGITIDLIYVIFHGPPEIRDLFIFYVADRLNYKSWGNLVKKLYNAVGHSRFVTWKLFELFETMK